MLLTAFGGLMWLLYTAMLVLAVVALVMAALFRDDAYRAADKKTKGFWLIILGVTVAVNLLIPMLFLQLAGLVATIVFRRRLSALSRRSGGRAGPYNGGR
ncbi:DUF2516 family protein [Streptomyces jietaisiensis]|uniref:DUF2516 family protein n=1 Tax=Streptomyces griseoaurantiacus TaxID=68213 RepID=UPI002E2C4BB4|nr:DUF2516 family protein [Streptomyces jietaisiensis]